MVVGGKVGEHSIDGFYLEPSKIRLVRELVYC